MEERDVRDPVEKYYEYTLRQGCRETGRRKGLQLLIHGIKP